MKDVNLTSLYDYIVHPIINEDVQYTDLSDNYFCEFKNIYFTLKDIGFSHVNDMSINTLTESCMNMNINVSDIDIDNFFKDFSDKYSRTINDSEININKGSVSNINIVINKF